MFVMVGRLVLYLECHTFENIKILNAIIKNEMRNFLKR